MELLSPSPRLSPSPVQSTRPLEPFQPEGVADVPQPSRGLTLFGTTGLSGSSALFQARLPKLTFGFCIMCATGPMLEMAKQVKTGAMEADALDQWLKANQTALNDFKEHLGEETDHTRRTRLTPIIGDDAHDLVWVTLDEESTARGEGGPERPWLQGSHNGIHAFGTVERRGKLKKEAMYQPPVHPNYPFTPGNLEDNRFRLFQVSHFLQMEQSHQSDKLSLGGATAFPLGYLATTTYPQAHSMLAYTASEIPLEINTGNFQEGNILANAHIPRAAVANLITNLLLARPEMEPPHRAIESEQLWPYQGVETLWVAVKEGDGSLNHWMDQLPGGSAQTVESRQLTGTGIPHLAEDVDTLTRPTDTLYAVDMAALAQAAQEAMATSENHNGNGKADWTPGTLLNWILNGVAEEPAPMGAD